MADKTTSETPPAAPDAAQTPAQSDPMQAILERMAAQDAAIAEAQARAQSAEARAQAAEDAASALRAKRSAAAEEPENDPDVINQEMIEGEAMDALMATQQTFRLELHQNDEGQAQLPSEPVQVNGGKIWNIRRGEMVEVPEAVYMVLVQAGLTRPQREEDYAHYPKRSVKPKGAAPAFG